MMRQRLYFKIYLAVLGSIVIFALATALLWRVLDDREERGGRFDALAQLVQNTMPDASLSPLAQQQALEKLNQNLNLNVQLHDAHGKTIAQVGDAQYLAEGRAQGLPPTMELSLDDGRTVSMRPPRRTGGDKNRHGLPMGWAFATGLLILFGAVALTALPLSRRLTRRIETLNQGVQQWGRGDLSTRVAVQGTDEVAKLADSFNAAASKVQELVQTNKMMLANASHELRTPLTRIRMNVEMLKITQDERQTQRKGDIQQDISELDEMIEQILLASRLESDANAHNEMPFESIDLLALLAEECAHYPEVQLEGTSVQLNANAKLMRRLVRNVVENARKYGKPPIEVRLQKRHGDQAGQIAEIHFVDDGAGVTMANPNDLFEPFVRGANVNMTQSGAGLGLSLVRKIAERHGGSAQIVSKSGEPMHLVVRL